MDFDEFQRRARAAFESIPGAYRAGIDGLTVSAEAPRHPTLPDIYTLGHCVTETFPSDWLGPDTTRSTLVLYHGSFRIIAAADPSFDWEEQLWETLTHELRHHLESLADDGQLDGVDYAMDEGFRRAEGLDFDPWYYQHGDEVAEGVYNVDGDIFIEQVWHLEDYRRSEHLTFTWGQSTWSVARPELLGDLHFLRIEGVEDAGTLQLVLVRQRSWRENLRGLLVRDRGASELEIVETQAMARFSP